MNKKIFSTLTVMAGVLALMGAGCSTKSLVQDKKAEVANPSTACAAGKEIAAPNEQIKELKTILNEAGSDVILTEDTKLDSPTQGTLAFVWKNEPNSAKLEAAFKKYGYSVEVTDLSITAQKGNIIFNVSLANDASCKTLSVIIADKSLKTSNKPTIDECAVFFAMGPKIDLRLNTVGESYPWTVKYYAIMAVVEKKYNITQDELSKDCKARATESGFNDAVNKQKIELGI